MIIRHSSTELLYPPHGSTDDSSMLSHSNLPEQKKDAARQEAKRESPLFANSREAPLETENEKKKHGSEDVGMGAEPSVKTEYPGPQKWSSAGISEGVDMSWVRDAQGFEEEGVQGKGTGEGCGAEVGCKREDKETGHSGSGGSRGEGGAGGDCNHDGGGAGDSSDRPGGGGGDAGQRFFGLHHQKERDRCPESFRPSKETLDSAAYPSFDESNLGRFSANCLGEVAFTFFNFMFPLAVVAFLVKQVSTYERLCRCGQTPIIRTFILFRFGRRKGNTCGGNDLCIKHLVLVDPGVTTFRRIVLSTKVVPHWLTVVLARDNGTPRISPRRRTTTALGARERNQRTAKQSTGARRGTSTTSVHLATRIGPRMASP